MTPDEKLQAAERRLEEARQRASVAHAQARAKRKQHRKAVIFDYAVYAGIVLFFFALGTILFDVGQGISMAIYSALVLWLTSRAYSGGWAMGREYERNRRAIEEEWRA